MPPPPHPHRSLSASRKSQQSKSNAISELTKHLANRRRISQSQLRRPRLPELLVLGAVTLRAVVAVVVAAGELGVKRRRQSRSLTRRWRTTSRVVSHPTRLWSPTAVLLKRLVATRPWTMRCCKRSPRQVGDQGTQQLGSSQRSYFLWSDSLSREGYSI